MVFKAVVFDLDGTLTTFNVDYRTVRAEVRSLLINAASVPASTISSNESIFEMLKKAEIFMTNAGKSKEAFFTIRRKALEIAEKHELEAAGKTDLLPGVAETLKTIKRMGLKMGLCTINSKSSTHYILNRFKLANYFDAVVSRDSIRNVKPNVEHLQAVLMNMGIEPSETVVVGDGANDMKCAHELKTVAVGLVTGFSSKRDLVDAGANYVITAITDLPALIESLNNLNNNYYSTSI